MRPGVLESRLTTTLTGTLTGTGYRRVTRRIPPNTLKSVILHRIPTYPA